MVRENECFSYPRFELTSDFYKEVLENVKGPQETVRDNKSSNYPVFQLPGVHCIFSFSDGYYQIIVNTFFRVYIKHC